MLGHEPRRARRHRLAGRARRARPRAPREPRPRTSTPARRCRATRSPSSSWSPISRAMVLDARVLILDEPTSSLDRGEVEQLFAVIRDLRDRGVAILFVSHFLDQVYEIADRITVLRNGELVGEYLVEDLPRLELVTKMIGRELDELEAISTQARARPSTGPARRSSGPRARAHAASLEPADLEVYQGEVVGIAGLLGSGPHRARAPALRRRPRRHRADRRSTASPSKLAHPAPRASTNGSRSPRRTAAPRASSATSPSPRTSSWACRPVAAGCARSARPSRTPSSTEYMEALDIRPANPDAAGRQPVGRQPAEGAAGPLAGDRTRSCCILDEPTRGIDVGAKADIQRKVAELSASRALGHLHLLRARGGAPAVAAHRRDARPAQDRRARLRPGRLWTTSSSYIANDGRRERCLKGVVKHRLFWPVAALLALVLINTIVAARSSSRSRSATASSTAH